jgi:flavin reductase (DIM6/NTAB) family NADH-FMN oxidoreductase RutF
VSSSVAQARSRNDERSAALRETAGRFATGVTVVTTAVDGVPIGMTVNAFTTVSLEPPLLLVSLSRRSRLTSAVRRSQVFAVTVLAADQEHCARWFATRGRPSGKACFRGIPTFEDEATGCPVLSEGVAYFGCRVFSHQIAGDHTLVIGRVESYGLLRPEPALLFCDGCYRETE